MKSAHEFLRDRGVPGRYLMARLDQFQASITPSAEQLREGSFFITGPTGCGKTHFACALLRETSFGISSRFMSSEELLIMLKDSYNRPSPAKLYRHEEEEEESEQDSVITRLCEIGILAIDDFGMERITDWSLSVIRHIINSRYNELRRTYITSNLTLQEIAKDYDQRIASRLGQMCHIVTMKGKDMRTVLGR